MQPTQMGPIEELVFASGLNYVPAEDRQNPVSETSCFQIKERTMYSSKNCDSYKKTALQTNKLHGLSPRVNYTDRATAACRRSDCQLLRIEGAT
jgi:hypothetical protein